MNQLPPDTKSEYKSTVRVQKNASTVDDLAANNRKVYDGSLADGRSLGCTNGKYFVRTDGTIQMTDEGLGVNLVNLALAQSKTGFGLPAGVKGDTLYHDGKKWVVLNIGNLNDVLTVDGAGIPQWAISPGAGPGGANDGTDVWVRVTKNTGVTKYYVDSSKDWRGFLIPIGVAKYGGTVANANTGQWDGIWGRPANNTDVEMVGASKTSNATLWAGTISSATVNLNIDYTGGADNGHLYLTVSGFGSEFQVRFLIGWPSMTAKSGPDVTI